MGSPHVMQSKVSAKGWVVIPAALRRRYRLQPGAIVEFREEGEKIVIFPRESDPVESLFGELAGRISARNRTEPCGWTVRHPPAAQFLRCDRLPAREH
jgi:AbrB family looped-hinge helix DNA binding protein